MMGAGCREVGSTRSGVAGTPVAEEDEVPRPAFFGAAGCSAGEADEGVPASAEEPPFAAFVRSDETKTFSVVKPFYDTGCH